MQRKSVTEWLEWQESLSPHEIDLGLDRVHRVSIKLGLDRSTSTVFTIGGTNGKGSSAVFLEQVLVANGFKTGCYLSPHLVRYNERIRIAGDEVDDASLLEAFHAVEAARGDEHLTYFEFGTLAAAWLFAERACAVWILEVGLGGRLDAVNAFEPDFSLLTSVALDHQDWLGESIEAIAREKAGIMRPHKPVFFSGGPGLATLQEVAASEDADFRCLGEAFSFQATPDSWAWQGAKVALSGLPLPVPPSQAQLLNRSAVLAAIESFDEGLLQNMDALRLASARVPAGRCQIVARRHQWVLEVAHNPAAAASLVAQLEALEVVNFQTTVLGMMADKNIDGFVAPLLPLTDQWVTCSVGLERSCAASELRDILNTAGAAEVHMRDAVDAALEFAQESTPPGGRILVCGSFPLVGAALQWLGL
jgi:dihydrofolate synthase/folylpolyglutamate synthase